jgi:hypothetical protein
VLLLASGREGAGHGDEDSLAGFEL